MLRAERPGSHMTDIAFAPATKLARMIRQKKIGCLELLDHYLDRVEKFNPKVNAIVATDIPNARKRAKAADRALAKGDVWGPFHGVPMTVKEAFDLKGLPTTWGVPHLKDSIATSNAVAVERWLGAGAIIFGKTNVPVWLADGQSFNAIYGATRNPWDLTRTPGGSSGGSSAALAAGISAIEVGSDIASSIRNPAHYCGLFGHKPTYGICPPRGHAVAGRVSADDINVVGPLARSAADLEPALNVMAGPDEIEAAAWKLTLPAPRKTKLREFKVGIITSDPASEVDQAVQDLLHQLAAFLSKQKVKVSDKARPDIDTIRVQQVFAQLLRGATSHRQTDDEFAQNLKLAQALDPNDDSAQARVLRANTQYHRDWLNWDEERAKLRWRWHEYFKEYDLLLAPAFPVAAHAHVHDIPPYQRTYTVNGKEYPHSNQVFWAGLTGVVYLPATVAPIGFTAEKLPVGVQIVGPYGGDRTTIQFAKLLEQEYQGFEPPPGYE
jgi:amidase